MSNQKNIIIFHQNPFYNDLFGTFDIQIPSKRVGYKQDAEGRHVITSLPKGTRDFEAKINAFLSDIPKPEWPYTGRLLIAILVHLTKKEYHIKDIDNLAKSLLDAMKDIVFKDDVQIDALHIVKQVSDTNGFFVGVKLLSDDSTAWYYPFLYQKGKPFDRVQTYRIVAQ